MLKKKRKGLISIAIVIVIVLFFSLTLVFYDFSRLSTAREDIDRALLCAMDSALVEYDETLYSKYNLMALSDEINANDIIESRLDLGLNRKNSNETSASYKVLNLETLQGAKLSNKNGIKRAVIRSHQKKFIANKISDWMEKFKLLDMIPEYSKSMKIYSKSIKMISKLKDAYDALRNKSEEIEKKYQVVKEINVKNCVNAILETKEEIKMLKEEKKEIKQEQRNCEDPELKKEFAKEIKEKEEEIKERKNTLKDLKENIAKIKNLSVELKDFSEKMKQFSKNTREKAESLEKEIKEINFEKNDKISIVMDKIKDLLSGLENAGTKVSEISDAVEKHLSELEEKIKTIDEYMDRSKKMTSNIPITIGNIEAISSGTLISIFGDKQMADGSGVSEILTFIWESISGDYLPDITDLETIQCYHLDRLPSDSLNSVADVEEKLSKPMGNKQIADRSFEIYENKSGEYNGFHFGNKGHRFIQKLIISDYVIETFHNINSENKSSEIKAEVEYILSGNKSEKKNVLISQGKIFALRMVFNGISILVYKQAELNETALSISSVTAFLGYPIAYGLISLAWSAIESAQDIKCLNNGEAIPILKNKGEIKTDLFNIVSKFEMDTFKNAIKKSFNGNSGKSNIKRTPSKKDNKDNKKDNPLSMNYKDHLFLFLMLENEEETLLRISDLLCIKEKINTNEYSCGIHTKLKVKIPLIFLKARKNFNVKKGSSYIYSVEKIRGY